MFNDFKQPVCYGSHQFVAALVRLLRDSVTTCNDINQFVEEDILFCSRETYIYVISYSGNFIVILWTFF